MHGHPIARIAYAIAAAWATVVGAYSSGIDWLGAAPRITIAGPVALICLAAAIRPTERHTRWAGQALTAYAVAQMIRVQWGGYPWRTNLIATTTYGMVATLGAVLLLHTTLYHLMSAGQGSVSDRRAP